MAVDVLRPNTQHFTTFEPRVLIPADNFSTENFQVRLARVLAKVFSVLADLSLSEKEKISLLKKEIKNFTKIQADAAGKKGTKELICTAAKVLFLGISMIPYLSNVPRLGNIQEPLRQFSSWTADTVNKWLDSGLDKKSIVAQSSREVLVQDMQNTNNDVQAKAGTRREFHEVLKEILQTFQTASRQT
ncbi:MAG: hypothetical protein JSS32_10515 [Verrucomicrobia bacterium]|nr:hypothetical protein [Verrucomicrobiota bacterium]